MNPDSELLQLYDHWRALTERERKAIQAADWLQLAEVQSRKQQLQEDIRQAAAAASHGPVQDMEYRHPEIGEQLMWLEQQNARTLAEKLQELRQQQQALDQTSRTLHQLHRAYAQGRESAWQSYS
jgi:hypothetical protein